MRLRFSGGTCSSVRMLWSRSISFDDEHPHVLAGRDQELAQALAVALGAAIFEVPELGDAVYQKKHILAELLFYSGGLDAPCPR